MCWLEFSVLSWGVFLFKFQTYVPTTIIIIIIFNLITKISVVLFVGSFVCLARNEKFNKSLFRFSHPIYALCNSQRRATQLVSHANLIEIIITYSIHCNLFMFTLPLMAIMLIVVEQMEFSLLLIGWQWCGC